ncbi:GNAT family N-acetyltransferase [Bifidobacterium pullorum]|uniref:GNAT family N-acetyltransferase n=1 Tax=Bifidobacterium pullorum TaxID=78448 RepID=UPI003F2112EF
MPMRIRHATLDDATAIASVEAACFPAAEAASEREVRARLAVYPNHFWLMVDTAATEHGNEADDAGVASDTVRDGRLVAFVNGFVTDEADLTDEMYEDASMHDEHGAWQMIFGVDTAPEYRHHGYASMLLRAAIEDARIAGRAGLVLTCKDRLIGFYERLGFVNEGVSGSTHGDVTWYQMRLRF